MTEMTHNLCAAACLLLATLPGPRFLTGGGALAQSAPVFQEGTVLPNDVAKYTRNGTIRNPGGIDGDNNGSGVNPFSATDFGQPGICTNSANTTGPYSQLCLGHDTTGNGIISLDSRAGLAAKTLKICTDGTCIDWPPPSSGGTTPLQGNSPENEGAAGNGTTNDSVAVLSCLTKSLSGIPCTLTTGKTYIVDALAIPSGARLTGTGTLKRLPSSTSSDFLTCFEASNIRISGITIDGNKANETIITDNINCRNYSDINLGGVTVRNSTRNGIHLNTSAETDTNFHSTLSELLIHSNDASGILGNTAAWYLRVHNVTSIHNGTYGAYFGPTGPANNLDSVLKYIVVDGGDYSYNGNSGLAAQGFVTEYVAGQPSFGPGIEPVFGALFTNVTANHNAFYGIVFQARESILANSITQYNASGTFGGGVLGNGEQIEIVNITSTHNSGSQGIGLDAGCGQGVHVIGGLYAANDYGINIGCSQFSSIRGATVTSNNLYNIKATAVEAAGDGFGIPGYTQTLVITGNRVACLAPNLFGIVVEGGGLGIEVSNNFVQNCGVNEAIIVIAASARIVNNTVPKSMDPTFLNGSGVNWDAPTGISGTLLIPHWVDSVALFGTNNITSIKFNGEDIFADGVYSVRIDLPGSGYTTSSTASWTGCTVAPTGNVFVTRSGMITGYQIVTPGSGCVNPAISFSIGSGAGATPYQHVLSASFTKELTLLVAGSASLTMNPGPGLALVSPITGAAAASVIKLLAAFNAGFYEISRAIH